MVNYQLYLQVVAAILDVGKAEAERLELFLLFLLAFYLNEHLGLNLEAVVVDTDKYAMELTSVASKELYVVAKILLVLHLGPEGIGNGNGAYLELEVLRVAVKPVLNIMTELDAEIHVDPLEAINFHEDTIVGRNGTGDELIGLILKISLSDFSYKILVDHDDGKE